MLTKIIKPGPDLFPFGTIGCGATIAAVSAISRCDLVDAFHMPVCIIVSTEGFRAIQAFVRLAVTRDMFSFPICVSMNAYGDNCHLLVFRIILRDVGTVLVMTSQTCWCSMSLRRVTAAI